MRVVLDTNTLRSALLSPHGPPRRLLDGARAQIFELCSSPVLMAELLEVVSREKFAASRRRGWCRWGSWAKSGVWLR